MIFRKIIFWLHLATGLVAGLCIAVMCFTGTTLAFEKQLVAWSEHDARLVVEPAPNSPRLSLDELARHVREANPDARPSAIAVSSNPRAAVAFAFGRERTVYANPFTGEIRSPASTRVRDFLGVMEDWHRWLALSGDPRAVGKIVNGTCNAAFFLLAVTGLYLWLPRSWSWRSVRAVAFFNGRLSGRARDFNWHNTIGLWCAPVLIVLTFTALPMSFRWANNLVYRLAGDIPPTGPAAANALPFPPPPAGTRPIGREAQFATVEKAFPGWEQISLRLAAPGARGARSPREPGTASRGEPQSAVFTVKVPGAWPRTATTTVTLNPFTAEILHREDFADQTAGRRARTWTRFLHTGEALGPIGQVVAGLASLGGCFLVYTGFALAWRRFFGKRAPS